MFAVHNPWFYLVCVESMDYGHIISFVPYLLFCFQFSIYMSNHRKECNMEPTDFINPRKLTSYRSLSAFLSFHLVLFFLLIIITRYSDRTTVCWVSANSFQFFTIIYNMIYIYAVQQKWRRPYSILFQRLVPS